MHKFEIAKIYIYVFKTKILIFNKKKITYKNYKIFRKIV